MKKILLIDESALFRDYLANKLKEYGFDVVEGKNGLDGGVKLRNELPDIVIMDYYLSRRSSLEVLQDKKKNPNIAQIPVIMISSKIDKSKIVEIAKYNIKKFFSKPLKLDALLSEISELMNVSLKIDETPCIIEAHFNDEILFIEIARGLNSEKIELLRYKITELLDLYQVKTPKVLIMMSNIDLSSSDSGKLNALFSTIIKYGGTTPKYIKILTNSDFLKDFISSHKNFNTIGVANNLETAMDDLLGLKSDKTANDEVVREKLLTVSVPKSKKEETIELRFEDEKEKPCKIEREAFVAVVDDDIVIQELVKVVLEETGWRLKTYNNGKEFVSDLADNTFDLVFLDLMMPEMNGFQVLQYLKKEEIDLPVIVFSALSRKETVTKVLSFGVKSYMIKPIKPRKLLCKAAEVIDRNF